MADYDKAGADAANVYAEQFRQLINNDPDIQAVVRRVWGDVPVNARPSDTPKHLEKANDAASKEITRILQAKGIQLPDRTFINPRSGALEGHRGWSGLNGWQKAAIVGAVTAGTLGTLGAAGVIGMPSLGAGGAASGGATATGGATAAGGAVGGGSTIGGLMTGGGVLGGIERGINLANKAGSVIDNLMGTGRENRAAEASVYGTGAAQAAANRLREAQIAQSGPIADAQALKNIQRSGQLANYSPPPAATQAMFDKFGKRAPTVDAGTMRGAGALQAELLARQASGKPMTTFGIGEKTPQEIADEQRARELSLKVNQPGVTDYLRAGKDIFTMMNDYRRANPGQGRTQPVGPAYTGPAVGTGNTAGVNPFDEVDENMFVRPFRGVRF